MQASRNTNNDVSGYIVTYDAGFAKIGYANGTTNSTTSNGANTGRSQYGLGTTLGGVTIGLALVHKKQLVQTVLQIPAKSTPEIWPIIQH